MQIIQDNESMSKWTIYRNSGGAPQAVVESEGLEYHDEWMAESFVSVTVKSPVPIDFHFGDYLMYRGEIFQLNYDPNVVKKARRGSYGEGFSYDNIKLYAVSEMLKDTGFKDYVLNWDSPSNTNTYSSLGKFSFYADSVEDLADRIQANLDRTGATWRVLTPSYERTLQRNDADGWSDYFKGASTIKGERDVSIDIDGQKCWDAINLSYTKFGLAWFVRGYTVVIGGDPIKVKKNDDETTIFRYGKDLGLYEVERTSSEDQELVTKLFAYGSEKNMPGNYYANIGKKVKITVACKSEREIIMDNPLLLMWTNTVMSLNDFNNAFGPTYETTLNLNNTTIHAHTSQDTYTYGDEKDDPTLDHDTYYVYFYVQASDIGAWDFYNSVDIGSVIYLEGVDMNKVPSTWIEIPQDYNYPSLLAISKLMLPGFPDMSLNAWVLNKISTTTGDEKAQWQTVYSRYDFSTDKHDPWIMSKNYAEAGIIEGTVYFDGSQQKEVYPTIDNTAYNVVEYGSEVMDSGYIEEGGTCEICLEKLGFDWKKAYLSRIDETMTMSMRSGRCVARDFKVSNIKEETRTFNNTEEDVYVVILERSQDDQGRWYPNNENQIAANDTFIVTGIPMPDEYIEAAAEKLLLASCGYLDRRDHMRYTYIPKIDEVYMARQHDAAEDGDDDYSLHDTIRAGMQLEFEDTDLGIWTTPFIDVLTIKEDGNNGIPTYDVVLRDEKEKGTLESLTDSLDELLANPPVHLIERQRRVLQYIEYPEWDPNGKYYFETLNTETDVLETSLVWHLNCLWMCLRTLTKEEPGFGAKDWKCVRGNQEVKLEFYDSLDIEEAMAIYGLSVHPSNIDETIVPYLLSGVEDISDEVTMWEWQRDSGYTDLDIAWSGEHSGADKRVLNLTTEDFPSGWDTAGGRVKFICTATFGLADGEYAQIENQINVV